MLTLTKKKKKEMLIIWIISIQQNNITIKNLSKYLKTISSWIGLIFNVVKKFRLDWNFNLLI